MGSWKEIDVVRIQKVKKYRIGWEKLKVLQQKAKKEEKQ